MLWLDSIVLTLLLDHFTAGTRTDELLGDTEITWEQIRRTAYWDPPCCWLVQGSESIFPPTSSRSPDSYSAVFSFSFFLLFAKPMLLINGPGKIRDRKFPNSELHFLNSDDLLVNPALKARRRWSCTLKNRRLFSASLGRQMPGQKYVWAHSYHP